MERMICQCCGEALHKRDDIYECRYCGAIYRDDQTEKAADLLKGLLDDYKIEQLSNARRRLYETTHEKYPSSQAVTQAAGAVLSISPDDFMARIYLHSHDPDPHELIAALSRGTVSEWEAKETLAWLTRSLDMRTLAAVKDFADRHLKGAGKTEALNRIEDEAFKLDSGVYDLSLKRDVFLCYSTEDMPRVIEIMETFEENALSCFAAFRNLRHGKGAQENYRDAIFRAMRNCRVFVFLSSNSSRDPHRKGVAEELDHLVSDLKDKPRVEFLLEDYPERMPILAKRRMAEAFPHLEYCRDVEDLVVRVSKLLNAEENAEREKARKIAEEASERAKKELQAEFEAREAARKEELAKEREEQAKRQKELEERLRLEKEEQAKREKKLEERLAKEKEERERKQRELDEERLRLEKEKLEVEKRRIEAQKGSSALPPVGGVMDEESMLAMMEKAEELKRKRAEEAADKKKAEPVIDAIKAIGKVELTPECRKRIAAARACYSRLTERQRAFVHNADALLAAEREYGEAEAKERERKAQEAEEREKAIEAVFAMKILPNGGASVQGLLDKGATAATIPERYRGQPVTSIGSKAFSGCSKLESIAIPSTVTSIGGRAFAGCTSLKSIAIPEGVTSIGGDAFAGCTSLTSITIPEGVTSIGGDAFRGCSSLTSIIIPESVASIGDSAFAGCGGLTTLLLPSGLKSIGKEAFYNCSEDLYVCFAPGVDASRQKGFDPNFLEGFRGSVLYDVTDVDRAIRAARLEAESRREKEKEQAAGAKKAIKAIGDVEYTPKSKSRIDEAQRLYDALSENSKALVSNHATLVSARAEYEKLEAEARLKEEENKETKRINAKFSMKILPDGNASVAKCRDEMITRTAIPERYRGRAVTSIGEWAFLNCTFLKSIVIPSSVTSIEEFAFDNCTSLTSITIPESVTSIHKYAFAGCESLKSIAIPKVVTSIGEGAFSGCTSLTSITIPESVTSIGEGAFSGCTSLTSITIPDSVTSIGERAFSGCSSLTSIVIPKGVTSIGRDAFSSCFHLAEVINLSSLDISKGSEEYGYVGYYALGVVSSASESKLHMGQDGIATYVDGPSVTLVGYFGRSRDVTIPDSVTSIGKHAFWECSSLTSIAIPDSVTSIGEHAFDNCRSLKSLAIPKGVVSIGEEAFLNCRSLKSIAIPKGVTSIGTRAFYECPSLTSITIPDSVTSIGERAFLWCSSLKSITIPESVTSIGEEAFSGCSCDIHFAYKKPLFGYPKGFPMDCLKGFKGKTFWGGK